MKITFHGAAGGVTGSRHLLDINNKQVLLDCGMFQGHRRETREKNSGFAFDPKTVDTVVLSHGHLDHCGMLPLLVKRGFTGKIYATPATRDIAQKIMMDAAAIQEYDFLYLKKKKVRDCDKLAKPLFTKKDIPQTMRRFVTHDYVRNGAKWLEILPGLKLKFYDAGHILGSAVSVLEMKDGGQIKKLAYTGDLGRRQSPILHNPHFVKEKVNIVISESTYGGKKHRQVQATHKKLTGIISRVIERKGKLIVPAFSLGRTQEFVYIIHQLTDQGRIPRIPIYVDSPLAGRITEVFRKYRSDYDIESKLDFPRQGDAPLAFRNLIYTHSRDESMQLNYMAGPLVIISASGMAEGGRILHHLKRNLRSAKNTILFTGYQAAHTLGRRILEGQSPVRILGRSYQVRAHIEKLNELSAHADGPELVAYITHCKGTKKVFLVHGEPDKARALKQLILEKEDLEVVIPKLNQSFEF